ncbi:hypothetical protein JAAARDRAFT_142952 [Jaapia argillacea MUCL 33604]|uniref:glutathione transferase n=1 Tax=Jaapia argillacea MUCL 33604 TaxID=933084 RepID=A0A067P4P7_9AGAM|nr:hypothetical protein JAAARDRAFT_142952 [Jaapia argillacea MUCL 33604]
MGLKIIGSPISTCTRRVAAVCKELGVPYELVTIDFANGDHKSPAFLEKQPFGQAPYIDDDGFILYESRAICRYLVLKHGGSLIPKGVEAQAKFEQACSIEGTNFDPSAAGIPFELMFKAYSGGVTDPARVEEYAKNLHAKLGAYEKILSKQKFLAGDEITLADLFHLPYGTLLGACGYNYLEDPARPNLARWWKDVYSRPSWQAVKDGA